MSNYKQKERVQVLLFNRKREIIRKITVNRDSKLDSAWMKAIDSNAVFFEKANDF